MLKDQLRHARKAAKKTQQQVADYLGVNYSTYSGYETGKRQPDALKIRQIAEFLGVSGDYLLETGAQQKAAPKNKKDTVICEADDEKNLIMCYRSLNDAGKAAAVAALDGLSSNSAFRQEESNTVTA